MRPPQPSSPLRIGMPTGFIAGLIVGLLLGWFFHGVVGLLVRFGLVLVLLIPLAIIVWFFFLRRRIRSAGQGGDTGGMRVYTWGSGQNGRRTTGDPRTPPSNRPPGGQRDENVIDIEFEELKRQADDEGTSR